MLVGSCFGEIDLQRKIPVCGYWSLQTGEKEGRYWINTHCIGCSSCPFSLYELARIFCACVPPLEYFFHLNMSRVCVSFLDGRVKNHHFQQAR